MKILVITCGHGPTDDRIYFKEIQSLLTHGHDVVLLTMNRGNTDTIRKRFRHIDCQCTRLKQYKNFAENFAYNWKPDRVIIHEFELLPCGVKIKAGLKIPLIFDVHEAHREMWSAFSTKPPGIKQIINWSLGAFERFHIKHVDCVLVPSPILIDRYSNSGIATYFVPNYPRLISFNDGIATEKQRIIYHGQISYERGIGDLIEAVKNLPQYHDTLNVDIYGSERLSNTITRMMCQIKKLGLGKIISIHDSLLYDDILVELFRADIGIVPFHDLPMFQIAVPIKLFEYMMCNCVVVTSDLPLIREFIGDIAHYYSPGDIEGLQNILITVLENIKDLKKRAIAGRKLIEKKYNWGKIESMFIDAVIG
ncbi:MAG: glycosyltransferase [Candidatus Marinimicrobia bacterium]|nr:glycosyltransferase [Candidatus Neomarinimicrobiota bacterium]